jgi:hypothetical protein
MDEPAMNSAIEPGPTGNNISGSIPAEFATRHSSPVVIAIWLLPLVVIGGMLVGTFWFVGSFREESWATLYEGRSFDSVLRRKTLNELQQTGVKFRVQPDGRIFVRPAELAKIESTLEKKGLRPETLEELRTINSGPLAILESPVQREERQRNQKEKELTWLIRRAGEFSDVQVSLEPLSATRRFINDSSGPAWRVRVFLEPPKIGEIVNEKTLEKIRNIITASITGVKDDQITIHDAENIYILGQREAANTLRKPDGAVADRFETKTLENRIRRGVAGLGDAEVKITLSRSSEIQSADSTTTVKSPEKPVLYFNEPVSIDFNEKAENEKPEIVRARVLIGLFDEKSATPELRRQIHTKISAMLSPILLENLDWVGKEPIAMADVKSENPNTIPPVNENKNETVIKTLVKTSHSMREPWIIGGIAGGLLAAIFIGRRLFHQRKSNDFDLAVKPMPADFSDQWRMDASSQTPPAAKHAMRTDESIPVEQAADVLSEWISGVDDMDKDDMAGK